MKFTFKLVWTTDSGEEVTQAIGGLDREGHTGADRDRG